MSFRNFIPPKASELFLSDLTIGLLRLVNSGVVDVFARSHGRRGTDSVAFQTVGVIIIVIDLVQVLIHFRQDTVAPGDTLRSGLNPLISGLLLKLTD